MLELLYGHNIVEPDLREADDVIGFNNFSEVFDDITNTLNTTNGPVIIRTDIQASLGSHDWCKFVFDNKEVNAVYYLDPIANLEYLKDVLEGYLEGDDSLYKYTVVLNHETDQLGEYEIPYDALYVWREPAI